MWFHAFFSILGAFRNSFNLIHHLLSFLIGFFRFLTDMVLSSRKFLGCLSLTWPLVAFSYVSRWLRSLVWCHDLSLYLSRIVGVEPLHKLVLKHVCHGLSRSSSSKTFEQTVSQAYDFPLSHLPPKVMLGDTMSVKFTQYEFGLIIGLFPLQSSKKQFLLAFATLEKLKY